MPVDDIPSPLFLVQIHTTICSLHTYTEGAGGSPLLLFPLSIAHLKCAGEGGVGWEEN